MKRYYKITGLNEGHSIEPYVVEMDETKTGFAKMDSILSSRGEDSVRYCEEISYDEFLKYYDQETLEGKEWAVQNKVDEKRINAYLRKRLRVRKTI